MPTILYIIITVLAVTAFVYFNSDLYERRKKRLMAAKRRMPTVNPITQEIKDIFKPLI